MFTAAVTGIVKQRGRRGGAAEGAVITDVHPGAGKVGLALGQDWHSGIVAMNPPSTKHMRDQQLNDRVQHRAARPHLVGECGEAEWHTFSGIAFSLAVERLVLAEFLEHQHGQKAGAGPAAADNVEGCGRLRNLLAIPAGEFFTHMLDHFPGAGDRLQGLGHVLPQLGQARPAAAGAGGGAGHDHALTWQMVREWLAGRPLAGEGRDIGGISGGSLGRQFVLSRGALQLFEFKRHLVEQA